jgi:protein-disulfide isomerase
MTMHASRPLDLLVPVTTSDHVRGPIGAQVTIVEYGDFECPICRAAEPAVQMVLRQFPGTVRLVYRHFPIETAHPHALMAAEAAEAAAAQGRFWEMHDCLIQVAAKLDRKALDGYAQGLGLDMALFAASLNDEIYRQRVREHFAGGQRSHVRASPGFFVNGRVCDLSGGFRALGERVEAEL